MSGSPPEDEQIIAVSLLRRSFDHDFCIEEQAEAAKALCDLLLTWYAASFPIVHFFSCWFILHDAGDKWKLKLLIS